MLFRAASGCNNVFFFYRLDEVKGSKSLFLFESFNIIEGDDFYILGRRKAEIVEP
jgi:hypothetical protein